MIGSTDPEPARLGSPSSGRDLLSRLSGVGVVTGLGRWLIVGVLFLLVASTASTGVAPLVVVAVLVVIVTALLRRSRSGHGAARGIRGLTRYRWSELPTDLLMGVAVGDTATGMGIGIGGAVLLAGGLGVAYKLLGGRLPVLRLLVGTAAVASSLASVAGDDGCSLAVTDRPGLYLAVAASVVGAVLTSWAAFVRIGCTGPRLTVLDLPLLLYGLVEIALFAFTEPGADLYDSGPGGVLAVAAVLFGLGFLVGVAPGLILGLLGVGLGAAKLMLAVAEERILADLPAGAAQPCLGGWGLVLTAAVFVIVSGLIARRTRAPGTSSVLQR